MILLRKYIRHTEEKDKKRFLRLGSGTDTRDRKTDIDGGTDTAEE
jgi:hypothetical protein